MDYWLELSMLDGSLSAFPFCTGGRLVDEFFLCQYLSNQQVCDQAPAVTSLTLDISIPGAAFQTCL